ncbi:MAG TPA: hypothetical protein ENF27_02065 [Chloroflexi bacterium]|nr:hypothetical protein [Chloroflexota bacterium]
MSLIPFLSVLFLIINPVLLWLFKRLDQNLQKLQFWMMLTTGIAWLISLVFFFLTPEDHLNPIWDAGEKLLPSLAFSLDWISSSYFLVVTTLIFFGVLIEGNSSQTNAWITGLGGVCAIGTLMDSAYTLAMVWTIVEALALYGFLKNQGEMAASHRYVLGILVRLIGPLLVIFISLVNSFNGIAPFLTELPSSAAPILLAAGMIGFGGWFLSWQGSDDGLSVIRLGKYQSWIPAVLGLVLITRAAQIFNPAEISPAIFLSGSILIFLVFLTIVFFDQPNRIWKVGSLALFIGGFAFAAPEAVLIWGVVFLLPGLVLFRGFGSKRAASLALIVGGIGILPLPFFPSWVGFVSLTGIPGLFFSMLAGVLLGRIFNYRIQNWRGIEIPTEQISPLTITGYAVVLISQYSISVQAGLIKKSLAFTSVPVSAWIAALLFGLAVLFWDRIPAINTSRLDRLKVKTRIYFDAAANSISRLADGIVYLLTRLFEGDGGLIWTLLLGFLIITLISLRGG